jgi:hypothetical protein
LIIEPPRPIINPVIDKGHNILKYSASDEVPNIDPFSGVLETVSINK